MWEGGGTLGFISQLAEGPGREALLYKLAMKAVNRDGQGSAGRDYGGPGMPGPLLRSQCLFTVYLS